MIPTCPLTLFDCKADGPVMELRSLEPSISKVPSLISLLVTKKGIILKLEIVLSRWLLRLVRVKDGGVD